MVDLNINIKVPAIEKLVDYVASGIGAVAGPLLAPWKASREGKAKFVSTQVDVEARLTEAKSEGESLKIIAKAQSEARQQYLVTRDEEARETGEINRQDITQWIEFQEGKRLANIRGVIVDAAEMLADKKVADHEPDPDWTARFFNCAQDISSEDMRKIWAKILAGEVERSGKTSLRTMETLRNMTKRDAELFEKIAGFIIGSEFIFYNYNDINYGAIDFDDILHLEDCGLIKAQGLIRKIHWKNEEKPVFTYRDDALMITGVGKTLEIPVCALTTAGKELSQIVQGTKQMEYLQYFSRFLQSRNYQLFYLEVAKTLPDGQFKYSKRTKIEPNFEQPAGPTT